jgi:hypothetical protein
MFGIYSFKWKTVLIGTIFASLTVMNMAQSAHAQSITAARSAAVSTPGGQSADELKSQLLSKITVFAEKAKLDIDSGKLFYATVRKGLVATVPVKSAEKVDPRTLANGAIDVGVVLLTVEVPTSDGKTIPPGIYRARWVVTEEGGKGSAELLDEQNRTIVALKGITPKLGRLHRDYQGPSTRCCTNDVTTSSKLVAASYDTSGIAPGQYGGSDFTRCYGILLFCCYSNYPYYGGETICRWCGFCFGLWW